MTTDPAPYMLIGIAACQLAIFCVFLGIRHRFYCRAEHLLLLAGMFGIFCGTAIEGTGHGAANFMRLLGWISYLIGLLIQFLLPARKGSEP